jgi:hypothetical protein
MRDIRASIKVRTLVGPDKLRELHRSNTSRPGEQAYSFTEARTVRQGSTWCPE